MRSGLRPGAGGDNVSGGAVSLIPGPLGRTALQCDPGRPAWGEAARKTAGKPWGSLDIPGQICQDAPAIPRAASSTADASPSGGAAAVSLPPEKKSISPSISSTPAKAIL